MKNSLDDAVKEVLTERLNYDEDHGLMDIRLVICGLAVAVAMFALAWDYFYPFPASRYKILPKMNQRYLILYSIVQMFLCNRNSIYQDFYFIADKC